VRSVQSWSLRKNYYRDVTSVAVHCLAARVGDGILVDRGRALLFVRAHHAECASGFAIQQGSWSRDARIFFFNLTNCEQTAICLVGILQITLVGFLRPEGDDIVTCRAARSSQNLFRIDLAFCCECGSADLEVCYTSKALGPHLCPTCTQSMVEYGTWKDTQTRSSMREQPVA
jgi:hypothetical protein